MSIVNYFDAAEYLNHLELDLLLFDATMEFNTTPAEETGGE